MKGVNTLKLNQESMREIVEYYLRTRMFGPFERNAVVTSVDEVQDDDGYVFEVQIKWTK